MSAAMVVPSEMIWGVKVVRDAEEVS